jgi:glycosyltransferase involved in cell wall biosynthesis
MGGDKIEQNYILITSMNFPVGGAGATYLNLFCRGLKQNGCKIKVLLLKGYAFGNNTYTGSRNNITEEGIPYSYLGFKQRPGNHFLKLLEELISMTHLIAILLSLIGTRKSTHLLVYNGEIHYNIPIHLICKIFRIRISRFVAEYIDKSEFGGSFFQRLKRYGYILNFKYLNKLSDQLLVFSHYLKNEYINMGYNEKNILVQPNLTDFSYWEQSDSTVKYDLGYSGAPYLKDGLNDLFKAMSILSDKKVKVTLLVIGDASFGKTLIPALKSECNRLGLSESVTFSGLVNASTVKQLLSECKILTITRPSTIQTKAGFPTKLGEYFASGKPVLATNFGDMEKYFTDGYDIIMAECENHESIALKIMWMLENSKELEVISQRGYDKAKKLLEYKSSVNKMINFLRIN